MWNVPGPEIEPMSRALADGFLTARPPEKVKVKVLLTHLCPILCDPMDPSQPGSSVPGILQASILEWVAISYSRGSS